MEKHVTMIQRVISYLLVMCMMFAMAAVTGCGASATETKNSVETEVQDSAVKQTAEGEETTTETSDEETTVSQKTETTSSMAEETTAADSGKTTEETTESPVTDQPKTGNTMVSLEGYDTWGYSNGGVIPVRKNGLWGALNYNGEEIIAPAYSQFYSPTKQGYVMFENNEGYYVYDAKGTLLHSFTEDVYEVAVGNDGVIMLVQARGANGENLRNSAADVYWEDGLSLRIRYMKMDGTVFYDSDWIIGTLYLNESVPYSEGKAYVRLQPGAEDREDGKLYEVTLSGTKLLGENYDILRPLTGMAQGYLLATGTYEAGYYLYQPSTDYVTPNLWSLYFNTPYGNSESAYWDFVSYKENGVFCYNYKTYGVITIYFEEKSIDVLFDFNAAHNTMLTDPIAMYDDIVFDNYQYLAVRDGDTCFYIDYSGKVVSPTYLEATSFNDRGYAMVMEEEGTAYVINSRFEKVETIENVADIGIGDVVFVIEDLDGVLHMMYYAG